MQSTIVLATLAACSAASYSSNINFGSPSHSHPSLSLPVPKLLKRQSYSNSTTDPSTIAFTHGVASGDPYPRSVILWTRASPMMMNDDSNTTVSGAVPLYSHERDMYIDADPTPVCVQYRVSSNEDMSQVVDQGTAYTVSVIDYTVKVEAKNLQPFTTYYYQFNVCGSTKQSPLGRTKTSPSPDDGTSDIGLAVYSCSNFPNGFFNAFGNAARKDNIDYVLHLGDYIYEYGPEDNSTEADLIAAAGRAPSPSREIITLYDYRTRIAQYRTDPDLLLNHQMFPWISVWDDHEIANNGFKDGFSGMNNTQESYEEFGGVSVDQRKMNAVRAYFEWMPLRQVDAEDNFRIWRSFQLGKHIDLIMLDTRYYDRSITDLDWNAEYIEEIHNDTGRSLMGSRQENWFYSSLSESNERGATWRIIGNQIVFSRVNISSWYGSVEAPFNNDQWDGYIANRNRTLQHLYSNNIPNNIMLAGDSHNNWVSDLVWLDEADYNPNTGANAVGVEFAGTAVSSGGIGGTLMEANDQSQSLIDDNEELQWQEGYYRGYFELRVSADRVDAQYFGVPTIARRVPWEIPLANFTVLAGSNKLQRPVAGGRVEAGALQADNGAVTGTNVTLNTESGKWFISREEQMFIVPDH